MAYNYKKLTNDEIMQLEFQAGNKAAEMLDEILDSKLDVKLDASDNGKILQVGADGAITPMTSSEGLTIDDTLSVANSAADAKKVGDEVADLKSDLEEVAIPDNYVPELTDTAARVDDYIITADGTVTANSSGYYLQNIPVTAGKKYTITVTSNGSATANTRVHGYSGSTWQEQIEVVAKSDQTSKAATFTVPSGVDNLKIGTTKTEYVSLKPVGYGLFDLVDENDYEPIRPIGSIDGIIDDEGVIQSSNTAKVFYAPARRYGHYMVKRQIESYSNNNYFAVAEYGTVPAAGSTSNNFTGGKNPSQLTLDTLTDGYIAWSYSGNQSAGIFETLLSVKQYALNAIPHSAQDLVVNMGNPYTYLSAEITDEDLDSTDVDDVYAIYDALVTAHPEFVARLDDIGTDASGLPMRLYRIGWQQPWMVGTGKEASWSDADNIYNASLYGYQKIFVNAGTHGNEKSSVYGVALSIQEIVNSNEPWALYVKGNFIIDVCPVANPWGYNNTSRNGYGDVNINRDFLRRTRPESQAIYNLLVSGGYHAAIDSHNSGGNANYFGITNSNPLLKTYVQMNMKLAGIVYNSWEALASGDEYAVKPYMQCWVSAPIGMMQDMFNELGIPGYLIESVGVFKNGIGVLTPNHKKYCKFTKDLLINSIIALGSTQF